MTLLLFLSSDSKYQNESKLSFDVFLLLKKYICILFLILLPHFLMGLVIYGSSLVAGITTINISAIAPGRRPADNVIHQIKFT